MTQLRPALTERLGALLAHETDLDAINRELGQYTAVVNALPDDDPTVRLYGRVRRLISECGHGYRGQQDVLEQLRALVADTRPAPHSTPG